MKCIDNKINQITADISKFSTSLRKIILCSFQKMSKDCQHRRNKSRITTYDDVAFRLLYSQRGATQLTVRRKLNVYKNEDLCKQAYIKSENRCTPMFFTEVMQQIIKYRCDNINHKYNDMTIIIDGTWSVSHKYTYNITEEMKGNYMARKFMIAYEPNLRCPITISLGKDDNERTSFIDFIKCNPLYNSSLFVFDGGYFSYEFLSELHEIGIKYIMRVKSNNKFVDKEECEYDRSLWFIYKNNKIITSRLIKYHIDKPHYDTDNEVYYCVLTNLDSKEYPLKTIKDIYYKRWSVEECIKLLKHNTKAENYTDYIDFNYHKTIVANAIVCQIASTIEDILNKHLCSKYKALNKTLLFESIYGDLLLDILTGRVTMRSIRTFCNSSVDYYDVKKGRSYPRICQNKNRKWWSKQRLKILDDVEQSDIINTKENICEDIDYYDPYMYIPGVFKIYLGNRANCMAIKISNEFMNEDNKL
jgi:DDE family transposase